MSCEASLHQADWGDLRVAAGPGWAVSVGDEGGLGEGGLGPVTRGGPCGDGSADQQLGCQATGGTRSLKHRGVEGVFLGVPKLISGDYIGVLVTNSCIYINKKC
jgi:hypothetical protein